MNWILRYLQGTVKKCLYFTKGVLKVQGYINANFVGEIDHRRSTTCYVFVMDTTVINWMPQIQKIVVLSTIDAEYIVVKKSNKEMIWLRGLLIKLGFKYEQKFLYCDSQTVI